jgi:putative DNA primase/helicase
MCDVCGYAPCESPGFCQSCRDTDRKKSLNDSDKAKRKRREGTSPVGNGDGASDPEAATKGGKRLVVHNADAVEPEPVEWLWAGRIAIGKTTLIGGDPGLGKSQLSIFIAATITQAGLWPCQEGRPPAKRSVIMLSAEDGVADTIVPRLMAAGADRTKVKIVTAVHEADGSGRRIFNLTKDLDALEDLIIKIADVGLVIIDPVDAYIGGGVDSHKNAAVRAVLEPISELADRLSVAILALTHFSKQLGGKAIYRFIGSIAHVGSARVAFAVVADQEDKTRLLLLHAKNNLAPAQKGLAFRVEQHLVKDGIVGSSVFFESTHVTNTSADEALAAEGGSAGTAKDEVVEFLKLVLAEGRVRVKDVEAEARAACLLGDDQPISKSKPFRDARDELGVLSTRDGFGRGAVYFLSLPHASPMGAHHKNRAPMENEGAHGEERGDEGAHGASDERGDDGPSMGALKHHGRPVLGEGADGSEEGAHEGRGTLVANGAGARVWLKVVKPPPAVPHRCAQCGGAPDGKELLHVVRGSPTWLHRECARFFRPPIGEPPEAA